MNKIRSLMMRLLILVIFSLALVSCFNPVSTKLSDTDSLTIAGKPDKPPKPDSNDIFDHSAGYTIVGTSSADVIIIGEGEYSTDNYPLYDADGDVMNFGVKAYEGDDIVNLRAIVGVENSIGMYEGSDKAYDSPFNDHIDLGPGDDMAEMTSGMGFVEGAAGNDTIVVIFEQFLDPPDPPADPGGPFDLWIIGGSNKRKDGPDFDTLELIIDMSYMTEEQMNAYAAAIINAFEAWRPSPPVGRGELLLDTGTDALMALPRPVKINVKPDVENLRIKKGGVTIYEYSTAI